MSTNATGSFMGLLMQEELRKNPDLMKVDFSHAEKAAAEQRELNRKNQADRPKAPAWVEYDGLRLQLFRLNESIKDSGIRITTAEADIRVWGVKLRDLLTKKKVAIKAGQVHDERHLERQARVVEGDIEEAKKRLTAAQGYLKLVKATLFGFETINAARLKELETELDVA